MGCGASSKSKYVEASTTAGQVEKLYRDEHEHQAGVTVHKPDATKSKQQHKQDNQDYQQTMDFLLKVPLLRRLPADQQPLLAASCTRVKFQKGEVVFTQGDSGAEFFLIMEGEASVHVEKDGESMQVAMLKGGDYFGEKALLANEPRNATVKVEEPLKALKITRDEFQRLGLTDKLHFANRKAVAGGNNKTMETKPPTPKTVEQRELIAQALQENTSLSTMVTLDEARINAIIDVAWQEKVPNGHKIIQEGDIVADYFYIVQDGLFEITVGEEGAAVTEQDGTGSTSSNVVSMASRGSSFGELALLYLVPRAATITALKDSVVWVIDRGNFKAILMKATDEKLDGYVNLLDSVEMLTSLLANEKKAVAQALVEMHFVHGEVILKQGDPGTTFYLLYEGEVSVVKDGVEQVKLSSSGPGSSPQLFGERALLNNEPRAATVVVSSQTAKVLALDRASFNMLLGPLEDILAQGSDAERTSMLRKTPGEPQSAATLMKIKKEELVKIGLLGCGGFGAVELWEHKTTGETYALKGLSKGFIVRTGMQESVINEKNILMMTNSHFIIKLYATYNSPQMLYFLMEPALGGELYATYSRKGLHGSEKHARYYVAGTVFAFEHCHERRIIYRDLKPENLLFTATGHVKLTDMGLAKFVIGKTFTTCGTPDYFAPELIKSAGHTNAVDWWTLGILLFELLTGNPPFESPYPMQTYSKVLKGIARIAFPASCSGAAEQLVRALLQQEPSERLPMRPGGTDNVKRCQWYNVAAFDWEAMFDLTLKPPYLPQVKSKTDIANFCARKEDMPKLVDYKDDGTNWDKGFASV